MEPWSREPVGRFDELEIESDVLRDNPLGDPHVRPLWVYLPPAYEAEPDRRFPSIYLIQGMTGQLDMWRNRSALRPNVPERIDRLFAEDGFPPALVVFVDAWTSLSAARSSSTRREPAATASTSATRSSPSSTRATEPLPRPGIAGSTGKSSGGYGAMVVPMLRPDVFGGLATHSGDALFELCYLPEFRDSVRTLRDDYDGSYDRFWEDFHSPAGVHEAVGLLPPQQLRDGRLLLGRTRTALSISRSTRRPEMLPDDVWQRWLAWDPVRMARRHADALRSHARDLHRRRHPGRVVPRPRRGRLRRELAELGITDVFFELFDAGHGAIEYRYPLAIRYLAERLQ